MYICTPKIIGSVAQLNRAPDYGSGGWGFESLRDHRNTFKALACRGFFVLCFTFYRQILSFAAEKKGVVISIALWQLFFATFS
jgi:hypothetical protein